MEFKTIEFDTSKIWYWYADYLFEDIENEFENIMECDYKIWYDSIKDVKIYWDVSYSQWRWIGLDWFNIYQDDVEKLLWIKFVDDVESVYTKTKFSWNWRYKEVCLYVETTIDWWIVAKDNEWNEYKQEEVEELFEDKVKEIEKRLLKYWEDRIEELEVDELCRVSFNEWKEENNIEIDYEIRDINYETKKDNIKDDMILIATSGNTIIDWLWIEPLELDKHKREEITLEDWIEKNKIEEVFYTLK